MPNRKHALRALFFCLLCGLALPLAVWAQAPSFTLTPSGFTPANLVPGETASATISVTANNGFTGAVDITCAVTPQVTTGVEPSCVPSGSPVTPNGTVSLTVATTAGTDGTPPIAYQFTITGTSGAETETATLSLTVTNVPQDYTLSVSKPLSPTSVSAGNGATASILVTPVSGYTGNVTLSCSSVTPVVVGAPVCSFNSGNASMLATVMIVNGVPPPPVTLTVQTFGTTTQGVAQAWTWRAFYALWLMAPGLAIVGAGAGSQRGKRTRTLLGIFLLLAVAGSLIVLPSCNSTNSVTSTSGLITPKNTYTITLNAVDDKGVSPSNTTTAQATVSLTVN
jgi:hypothetical protein